MLEGAVQSLLLLFVEASASSVSTVQHLCVQASERLTLCLCVQTHVYEAFGMPFLDMLNDGRMAHPGEFVASRAQAAVSRFYEQLPLAPKPAHTAREASDTYRPDAETLKKLERQEAALGVMQLQLHA